MALEDFIPDNTGMYNKIDMVEFAEQEAVGFAQWTAQEGYEMLIGCFAWEQRYDDVTKKTYSTRQLYEIYVQSKVIAV